MPTPVISRTGAPPERPRSGLPRLATTACLLQHPAAGFSRVLRHLAREVRLRPRDLREPLDVGPFCGAHLEVGERADALLVRVKEALPPLAARLQDLLVERPDALDRILRLPVRAAATGRHDRPSPPPVRRSLSVPGDSIAKMN